MENISLIQVYIFLIASLMFINFRRFRSRQRMIIHEGNIKNEDFTNTGSREGKNTNEFMRKEKFEIVG